MEEPVLKALWSCAWTLSFRARRKARKIRRIWSPAAVRATRLKARAFTKVLKTRKRTCWPAAKNCARRGKPSKRVLPPRPRRHNCAAAVARELSRLEGRTPKNGAGLGARQVVAHRGGSFVRA